MRGPACLGVVLLLLIVPGVGLAQTNSRAGELEHVTLQLKWKHQFQFAGYYAAIEQGYYRDAGLQVQLLEAEEDQEPADTVFKSQADFGVATSDLVLLRNSGSPVVVLAPIFQHSPLVFLVAERSGITNIHDLKGKPLMVEAHAAELMAYLEFEGIRREAVTLVPHVFDPSSLINGQVAAMSAYSTDEPFLFESEKIGYLTFTPRAAGIDFYGDTLFTTEAQIREHPDRVRRFLAASLKGWRYALDHQEEIVDLILSKYSRRHSREHLLFEAEMTRRLILPDVVEVGYSNPGRWRHIADTYARMGMMPPGVSLEGFLYEQDTRPDLRRFYVALGLASLIIAVLSYMTLSLRKALGEIKVLRGIIPICAHCKNVRDDSGYWSQVERYISDRTDAEFSHAICSSCAARLYPDLYKDA